ncbi:DNA-binding transcriptional regulator, LacI/PurR family [Arthrobacter alpinus]|uniref:DNA-binding transcriptional regulator, LacI/PurR family n=1 Tax=Arthrobacter alpinus TaxID=656366 RepID=A0A1H5MZR9_9MICC|nr:LacI family DNA-binding transcriptional regulator [Arthrobacter alpinus]SEE94825.1 DNA-binding transcriptional regulator, LacI/PurR family [Arthrobacter alpinus]
MTTQGNDKSTANNFPAGEGPSASGTSHAKRGPSIADVARAAGVSAQTVSRVSNGHSNVEDGTRIKVQDAMRRLGYRPNGAARALKSGQFKSIGVIMFTLSSHGNMKTLDAIARAASDSGYSISLIPMPDPASSKFPAAYNRLREQQVDGVIIVFDAHLTDRADIILPEDLPTVVIDSKPDRGYIMVDTDQGGGAQQATEHLLSLGHANVWHIGGPQASFSASHRAGAWRLTLNTAGVTPPEVIYGDWSTESGYQAGLELGSRPEVTAIFAANDHMALGAMRALHELGRKIPRDVSVVGFDDLDEASSFWPPLSTVHQSFRTVGRLGLELLLTQIAGGQAPDSNWVPTRLVVRESTSAPSTPGG